MSSPRMDLCAPLPSGAERHDLRFPLSTLSHREQSHRHWQLKSARPATSWIEIEHTLARVRGWRMGMSEKHRRKLRRRRVQMQRAQVMQHVEIVPFRQHHFGLRQLAAWSLAIHIAANRRHRRNRLELMQNENLAHIAQMQNALDALQGRRNLWPQQSVRIADDADSHSETQFQPRARIEPVAQRIAQEVEPHDRAGNRRGREQHQMR